MNIHHKRTSAILALLLGAGLVLTIGDARVAGDYGLVSSAHAQPLRKLIARLRGQTQPYGIAKAEGRVEGNQVDVSSKYPGQLAEVSVEEGTNVAIGQAIARISSPEFEAQLRAAQSDLQSAQGALAAAEADIGSRKAALEFAKSDFERGQELMKSGFITKQLFEERQRNYASAEAAVKTMAARRDQARASIAAAEAKVQQIESMIQDLTLVSPRNGQVQFQLARKGETVAAGEPIVTVLDLTDLHMVIFLPAAETGRLGIGDQARVILDAVPDYVIPRGSELCRVRIAIHPQDRRDGGRARQADVPRRTQDRSAGPQDLLREGGGRPDRLRICAHATGRQMAGRTGSQASPRARVAADRGNARARHARGGCPSACRANGCSCASRTGACARGRANRASGSARRRSTADRRLRLLLHRRRKRRRPRAAPAPRASGSTCACPRSRSRQAAPTPAPAPIAEATPSAPAAQAPALEFAPQSLTQLVGAWAPSAADCDRLFQRRGKALAYRQPADKFAQAAIVEPQRIRLPSAVCKLETATREGGALRLSADCQDTISYTSRTVYIKLRSDTELFYSPTGDPVLATTLAKCPL